MRRMEKCQFIKQNKLIDKIKTRCAVNFRWEIYSGLEWDGRSNNNKKLQEVEWQKNKIIYQILTNKKKLFDSVFNSKIEQKCKFSDTFEWIKNIRRFLIIN